MRVPQFILNMAASVCDTLACIFTKPRIVREAEIVVDVAISLALAVIPGKLGWVACGTFFLLRDVATAKRQSPGKQLYNLKIVSVKSGEPVGVRTTVVRNLILITPVLNLFDIFHFVKSGRRKTDEWLGLDVIQENGANKDSQEVEDYPNPPTTD